MKQFDKAEAERLVYTYSDLILRLSYTYLKSTHDAEDICQTVFLKLLTSGQTFDLNGMTATIDEISLSPLALRVDYTVDSEVQWDENAQSGKQSEHDSEQMHKYFDSVQILVNKADGTSIDMSYAGGSISPEDGRTVCQKGDIFSEIVALEDVESVTVQGVEIPVQQ